MCAHASAECSGQGQGKGKGRKRAADDVENYGSNTQVGAYFSELASGENRAMRPFCFRAGLAWWRGIQTTARIGVHQFSTDPCSLSASSEHTCETIYCQQEGSRMVSVGAFSFLVQGLTHGGSFL